MIPRIVNGGGRAGIGECDGPPEAVDAFVNMSSAHAMSRNMVEMLVGADPVEIGALWRRLYDGTQYPGRRGLGIHALSAIDIALHELAGKQLAGLQADGRGDQIRAHAYATLFQGLPQGRSLDQTMVVTDAMLRRAGQRRGSA